MLIYPPLLWNRVTKSVHFGRVNQRQRAKTQTTSWTGDVKTPNVPYSKARLCRSTEELPALLTQWMTRVRINKHGLGWWYLSESWLPRYHAIRGKSNSANWYTSRNTTCTNLPRNSTAFTKSFWSIAACTALVYIQQFQWSITVISNLMTVQAEDLHISNCITNTTHY